jgi:hypothetical protein
MTGTTEAALEAPLDENADAAIDVAPTADKAPESAAPTSALATEPSTAEAEPSGVTERPEPPIAAESPIAAAAAASPSNAEEPTPAAALTPASTSEALDKVRALWPEIVTLISQNPPAKPLIAACRPISVEGNIVTLGFPEGQAFLKDALERRRPLLEDGIGTILGRPVNVRCVATNLELVPPVPGDADAAFVLAEARRIFGEDLVDVGEVS